MPVICHVFCMYYFQFLQRRKFWYLNFSKCQLVRHKIIFSLSLTRSCMSLGNLLGAEKQGSCSISEQSPVGEDVAEGWKGALKVDVGSCPLCTEDGEPWAELQTPELPNHTDQGLEQPGLVEGPSQMGLGELQHPLPPKLFHELHSFPAPSKSGIYWCSIWDFGWLPMLTLHPPCWILLKLQAGWGAAFGIVIGTLQSSCLQDHLCCWSIFGRAAGGVFPVQDAAVIVSHGSYHTGNFCVH